MSDKDILKDLFSEKLGNYEANVNPQLWNAISSKLATTAATSTAVGTTLLTKLLIGGSISAAALVGGYFIFSNSPKESVKKENTVELIVNSESKQNTKEKNSNQKENNSFIDQQAPIFQKSSDFQKENSDYSGFISANQSLPTIPFMVVPQEQIKVETPKIIEANTSVVEEEKKEIGIVKDPIVEASTPTESGQINEETTSTEEIVLYENVFTPNGDGVNDLFFIKSKGLKDFSIVIMNSKSMVVFKSNDPDFVWDGVSLNGDLVEEGRYLYYLTSYDKKGKPVNKYKELIIKR